MIKFWIGLITTLIGCTFVIIPAGEGLELDIGLAALYKLRGPVTPPPQVAIVYIDGNTAAQLDLPDELKEWPRSVHACVLKKLNSAGVANVIYDIAFLDPVPGKYHDVDICPDITGGADADISFVNAVADFGAVLLLERVELGKYRSTGRPIPATRTTRPFRELSEAALATAPFVLPEDNERLDHFWPYLCTQGGNTGDDCDNKTATLPQLAFLLFNRENRDELETMDSPSMGEKIFNFYGPPRTIPCRSYQTILRNNLRDEPCADVNFSGTTVFIGYAEYDRPDQIDSFHTVYSGEDGIDLVGVEVMATAYANLLTNSTLIIPGLKYRLIIIILIGILFGWFFGEKTPLPAISLCLVSGTGYLILAYFVFKIHYLVLPVTIPVLIQLPVAILTGCIFHYSSEKGRREMLKRIIGYFVPVRAVDKLISQGNPSPSTDLVYGVCLTTDAEGYTNLAERTDPRQLAELMNRYYAAITCPVEQYGGEVLDTAGDSVMCAWSADSENTTLYLQTCHAAVEILANLGEFNANHTHPPIHTRIGIHAGWFALGNVGGAGYLAYKAIGDIANTAARIEQLNKHLGTCLLSSIVIKDDNNQFLLRPCGFFRLKGKEEPVGITEILGRHESATEKEFLLCKLFKNALRLYNSRRWLEAVTAFSDIQKLFPDDGPTKFYLEVTRQYADSPTASEQKPVIIMKEK